MVLQTDTVCSILQQLSASPKVNPPSTPAQVQTSASRSQNSISRTNAMSSPQMLRSAQNRSESRYIAILLLKSCSSTRNLPQDRYHRLGTWMIYLPLESTNLEATKGLFGPVDVPNAQPMVGMSWEPSIERETRRSSHCEYERNGRKRQDMMNKQVVICLDGAVELRVHDALSILNGKGRRL